MDDRQAYEGVAVDSSAPAQAAAWGAGVQLDPRRDGFRGVLRELADAATPWNSCPECNAMVDLNGEVFDGSEVRCWDCRQWCVVVEVDGGWVLEPVFGDDDEPSLGDVREAEAMARV